MENKYGISSLGSLGSRLSGNGIKFLTCGIHPGPHQISIAVPLW